MRKSRFMMFGFRPDPLWGLSVGLLVVATACSAPQEGGSAAYRDDFQRVFGDASEASREGREAPWAILLNVHSGRGAMERAEEAAAAMRERFGLASARAVPRSGGAVVVFGGYDSPGDQTAQRDLQRIQAIEAGGARPFRTAFLSPQGGPAEGSHPELNLNNARANHGQGAKYTLQIAVYESADRQESMKAAEDAALELRREGEMAFYYHGPTKSMVTLGLFGDRDYDPGSGRQSAAIRELQSRYPHNLLNGRTIIERRVGGERTQPSALVAVPGD